MYINKLGLQSYRKSSMYQKKNKFWNNFPDGIVATENAPRWSWEMWRMTILLRIQDRETGHLVPGLLIPSRQVETMPSCCLLVTSVCPVFKWNQMLPWSSGALLIPCMGQVCCFTCLGWGMRELGSILLPAAEARLKRVCWCCCCVVGSTSIVRGVRAAVPFCVGYSSHF